MPVANTAAGIEWSGQWLAGMLGASRAAGSPDNYVIHAWFDDPQGDSPSEVDFDGYAPAEHDADQWDDPDGAETATTGLVDLGTPTTSATDAARYWSIHRTSDDVLLYSAPLRTPVHVTAGGSAFQIRPVIPFGGRS